MSNGRNRTSTFRKADDTTPILVPDGAGIWTFGDHLKHFGFARNVVSFQYYLFRLVAKPIRRTCYHLFSTAVGSRPTPTFSL